MLHPAPRAPAGLFAWRQVQKFLPEQWPQYRDFFGGNSGGYLRSKTDLNNRVLVTRWPRSNLAAAVNETITSGNFDGPVASMMGNSTANSTSGGADTNGISGGAGKTSGGAANGTHADESLPFGSLEAVQLEADYLFSEVGAAQRAGVAGDGTPACRAALGHAAQCGRPPGRPCMGAQLCSEQEGRLTFNYPAENYERCLNASA